MQTLTIKPNKDAKLTAKTEDNGAETIKIKDCFGTASIELNETSKALLIQHLTSSNGGNNV